MTLETVDVILKEKSFNLPSFPKYFRENRCTFIILSFNQKTFTSHEGS